MATQFLLTSLGPIIGGMSLETFLLRSKLPSLYEKGETLPGVPKSFGLVVFVNVCCSTVVILTLGFKVSAARRKYLDKVHGICNDESFCYFNDFQITNVVL